MKKFILASLVLAPALAAAQSSTQNLGNIENFLKSIGRLVNIALPIVVGIALLGFFWGLAQFVFAAGDEEKRKEARQHMIWGIVALFVMVAVWGLVGFLGQTLGISTQGGSVPVPTVTGL